MQDDKQNPQSVTGLHLKFSELFCLKVWNCLNRYNFKNRICQRVVKDGMDKVRRVIEENRKLQQNPCLAAAGEGITLDCG